jgi:hypothetical protein
MPAGREPADEGDLLVSRATLPPAESSTCGWRTAGSLTRPPGTSTSAATSRFPPRPNPMPTSTPPSRPIACRTPPATWPGRSQGGSSTRGR